MIKLDVRQFLHCRPRMLTRDLFAVASLLVKFIGSLASFRYLQRLYTRTSMRQVQSYNQVVTNAAAVAMATSSLSRDGCEQCSERLNGIRQRSNWQWCCDVGPCRGREICRRVDVLLTDVIRSWRQRSSHLLLRGELERTMEIAGLAEWRNKQRGWRNDRIWRKAVEPFEVRRLFAFSPGPVVFPAPLCSIAFQSWIFSTLNRNEVIFTSWATLTYRWLIRPYLSRRHRELSMAISRH